MKYCKKQYCIAIDGIMQKDSTREMYKECTRDDLEIELKALEVKKKRCFNLCTEIHKRKHFSNYVPERWYCVQRIGIKTMARIEHIKNELRFTPVTLGLNEYENQIEENRAIKEANVTSLTHDRWKKRINKQIDTRFGIK